MSLILPLAVVTAVTTFMALIGQDIKRNLNRDTRAPGKTTEGMAIPVSPSGEVTWCAMANKVTVLPRPSKIKEPRELTIFALGDQRVVIDLTDGTSKFRTTAEVVSIEQKRKSRRRKIRTATNTD
jgi:hypothetical protein